MNSLSRRWLGSFLFRGRRWFSKAVSSADTAGTLGAPEEEVKEFAKKSRKKWEDMLNSEFNANVDIERSIRSGATVSAILQFLGTPADLSLRDFCKLTRLVLRPTIFQVPLFDKVRWPECSSNW